MGVDFLSIDVIFVMYLYFDYIGGLVGESGYLFFNVELIVSEVDFLFWIDFEIKGGVLVDVQFFFDFVMGVVGFFGDCVIVFGGEFEVVFGIIGVLLLGYMFGYIGYWIESEGEVVLVWGDIIYVVLIQLLCFDVMIVFDIDFVVVVVIRVCVFDQVVVDELRVLGSYMLFFVFGWIECEQSGY